MDVTAPNPSWPPITELIVAQTTQLQDELVLKNFISKGSHRFNLIDVEIVPTDAERRNRFNLLLSRRG